MKEQTSMFSEDRAKISARCKDICARFEDFESAMKFSAKVAKTENSIREFENFYNVYED
jgi:hypothetical protein